MTLPAWLVVAAARYRAAAAIQAHTAAIEALVAILDGLEPDPDLEPSLGAQDPAWEGTDQELWAQQGNTDDREGDEHDGREPDVDDEPSLGAPECVGYIPADGPGGPWFSQANWAKGDRDDLEQQCEDEGSDTDTEGVLYDLGRPVCAAI